MAKLLASEASGRQEIHVFRHTEVWGWQKNMILRENLEKPDFIE